MSQGYENSLNKRTQMYEAGFSKLQKEYNVLMDLKLINKVNKISLERYKSSVNKWTEKSFSKFDLSIQSEVDKISKFYSQWLEDEKLREEYFLVKRIDLELSRLKVKDPDGFYKSDRYKEILDAINQITNCSLSDINSIAWKYGLAN